MANQRELRRRFIELTFEKGLLESQEASVVPPGFATELLNWVPEPSGALRARPAWSKGSTAGASFPSTRKCVGIGYFQRLLEPAIVQASEVAQDTAGGAPAPVWRQDTQKGNLLILVVGASSTGGATGDIATPAGGWVQAVDSTGANDRQDAAIFFIPNASVREASTGPTISGSNISGSGAQLIEVTGCQTGVLDVTASDNVASDATPQTGTTGATAQAVNFVVGILVDRRLEGQTDDDDDYTQLSITQVNATVDLTLGVYVRTTRAIGTHSVTTTTATADASAGAIAVFQGWFTGTPDAGQESVERIIAVHTETATTYRVWWIDRDDLASGAWTSEAQVLTAPDATQLVSFASGLGRTWMTNPQFESLFAYDGFNVFRIDANDGSQFDQPGRAIGVHKNRLFVAGSTAYPGRVWFSELNDGTTFDTDNDFFDLGSRQSGEPVTDMAQFEDGMLFAQRTALHFLSGDGPDTFVLERLNGGGAAPGRSIVATPYGAVIAGRRHVWLWGGGSVLPISRPIETTYRAEDEWVSACFLDESLYVLGELDTGLIHVLHLPTGVWRTENIDEVPSVLFVRDFTQLFGPSSSTVASLVNYREFPGASRGKDFDVMSQEFAATTEELWAGGSERVFTPERLHLGVRQRGGDTTDTAVTITPTYDGAAQAAVAIPLAGSAGTYRYSLSVGSARGIHDASYRFTQTVPSGEASVFDIERVVLELIEADRIP